MMVDKTKVEIEEQNSLVKKLIERKHGEINKDVFHWSNSFISGVTSRKDFLLKGATSLKPEYLPYTIHREVYKVYINYYKEKQLYLSQRDFFQLIQDKNLKDWGMMVHAVEMANREVESVSPEEFQNSIERLVDRQKHILFDEKIIKAAQCKDLGDLEGADSEIESYLREFRHLSEQSEPKTVDDIFLTYADDEVNQNYYYSTGIERIDKVTGGFCKGETVMIAGRPSHGKSSLADDIFLHNVISRENCLYISLEMGENKVMNRLCVKMAQRMGYTNLTLNKVKKRQFNEIERGQFKSVIEEMRKYNDNLWIYRPLGRFTVFDLGQEVDKLLAKKSLDIVVLDYMQLLDSHKNNYGNRQAELKEMARIIKRIANEKDILTLIPHQISRAGEDRARARKPTPYYLMDDLGESSGVEENAVIIVWIYNGEEYDTAGRVRIGICKNRDGRKDIRGWEMNWDKSRCIFEYDGEEKVGKVEFEDE
jgi:replicative DNA helicase